MMIPFDRINCCIVVVIGVVVCQVARGLTPEKGEIESTGRDEGVPESVDRPYSGEEMEMEEIVRSPRHVHRGQDYYYQRQYQRNRLGFSKQWTRDRYSGPYFRPDYNSSLNDRVYPPFNSRIRYRSHSHNPSEGQGQGFREGQTMLPAEASPQSPPGSAYFPKAQPYRVSRNRYSSSDRYQANPTAPIFFKESSVPGIPGRVGLHYPAYHRIPKTGFSCTSPGYYADIAARCQAFHVCQADGRMNSFLCPNGTIFSQKVMTCEWWPNVECPASASYFFLNSRIGLSNPSAPATLDRFK